MAADQDQGIAVDLEAVSQRAYARIGKLTMQVDQWETAYQAQGKELAMARAELEAFRSRQDSARSGPPDPGQ